MIKMSDDKLDKLIKQNEEILAELRNLQEENRRLKAEIKEKDDQIKQLLELIEKMQERQERLESRLNKQDIEDLTATLYLQNRPKEEIKEKLSDIDKRATDKYFESAYQKISNNPDYQRGRVTRLQFMKEEAQKNNMTLNEFKEMQFIGTLFRLNHKKRVEAGLEPDVEIEQGDYDALEDWYESYLNEDNEDDNPAW